MSALINVLVAEKTYKKMRTTSLEPHLVTQRIFFSLAINSFVLLACVTMPDKSSSSFCTCTATTVWDIITAIILITIKISGIELVQGLQEYDYINKNTQTKEKVKMLMLQTTFYMLMYIWVHVAILNWSIFLIN